MLVKYQNVKFVRNFIEKNNHICKVKCNCCCVPIKITEQEKYVTTEFRVEFKIQFISNKFCIYNFWLQRQPQICNCYLCKNYPKKY